MGMLLIIALFYVLFYRTVFERADYVAFVCDVYLGRCHFPIRILGQVRCLIVSIPDLCPLSFFVISG